jgi:hypothetical protein
MRKNISDSDDLGISTDSEALKGGEEGKQLADILGADIEELVEYGQSLGIDLNTEPDLTWVVREAFAAPLPPSWTEHADEATGKMFFFNQVSQKSHWTHPTDEVFKELLCLIKSLRNEVPATSQARKMEAIQAHIQEAHSAALEYLDGWSGPYESETGLYFYNRTYDVSTWENPVLEFEQQLQLRQRVLHACLFMESCRGAEASSVAFSEQEVNQREAFSPEVSMPTLNLAGRCDAALLTPTSAKSITSARSFGTARSHCSSRERSARPVADGLASSSGHLTEFREAFTFSPNTLGESELRRKKLEDELSAVAADAPQDNRLLANSEAEALAQAVPATPGTCVRQASPEVMKADPATAVVPDSPRLLRTPVKYADSAIPEVMMRSSPSFRLFKKDGETLDFQCGAVSKLEPPRPAA